MTIDAGLMDEVKKDAGEFQEELERTLMVSEALNRIMLRSDLFAESEVEWRNVRNQMNLVARAFGVADIRRQGSGNIGATNVLRTAGRLPAILTLLGDAGKGAAAVGAAGLVAGGEPWATAGGAVAAIVGNCWSVFLRFRGGKGVATGLGAYLALIPWATAPAVVVWVAVTGTFRFVSLASITAA